MSHTSRATPARLEPRPVAIAVAALLAGMGLAAPAWSADLFVSNDATLRSAITSAAAGDRIVFQNSITLAADLPTVGTNVTIVGNGNTLSGNNQFRGLFIGGFAGTTQTAVAVSIQDLTISNARAQGGSGTVGSGGGAGLGGAIFVANQATLNVSNVTLATNSALGGAGGGPGASGGGGGMGGNGGTTVGGGGGLGIGSNGGTNVSSGSGGIATGGTGGGAGGGTFGSAGGANGGGGGGANNGSGPGNNGGGGGGGVGGANGVTDGVGGAGGFGGGGGAAVAGGGGAGGFGGGGGGGNNGGATGAGGFGGGGGGGGTGATGGFGGGNGGTGGGGGGGGGGAGMGGAVFVQQGGTLNITGAFNVNGGTATGGAPGFGTATAGSGFGSGMFLQGNGTVSFTPAAGVTQTVSDVITDQTGSGGSGGNAGSWTLSKSGAGTLVLLTANDYSGGTTVSGGLVSFAANSLGTGAITLNGGGLQWIAANTSDVSAQLVGIGANGATFDTNGNNVSFATPLGGTGGVTKAGAGALTLSGANTYSGGTTVNAGTLELAPGASLQAGSALTVNGGTFATNGDISIGALAGSGGAITLAGVLTADSGESTTLATAISGAGGLTKSGAGTLNLTGTHTYTGPTNVNGGTLAANGTLASVVTVNNGGTLGGTGTIGGADIRAGGTFAPGNSIGTTTVAGNVSFAAGSTYIVEADAAGNADRINATGAATLGGGTVQVQAAAGNYQRDTTYTILNAAGGVTGRFDTVTSNLAFLEPTLAYDPNNVLLTLTRNTVALSEVAVTPNQRAVAGYLEQVAADPGAAALMAQVEGLSEEQARAAFTSIGGDSLSALATASMSESRRFLRLLGGRLTNPGAGTGFAYSGVQLASGYGRAGDGATMGAGPADGPASGRGFWAQATGSRGNMDGDGNASGFDWNGSTFAVGLDTELSRGTIVGAAFGYGQSNVDLDAGGSGKVQSPRFALYGSRESGPWTFRGAAAYADQDFDSRRNITVGANTSTATGSHGGKEWSFSADAEYTFAMGSYQLRPLAGLVYVNLKEDAYTESGSNAALAVSGRTTESITSLLGLRFVRSMGSGIFEARAVWSHEFGDTDPAISGRLATVPAGPSFTVVGVPIERDALTLGTGFSGQAARNLYLYADFNVELRGSGQSQYAAMGGLRYSF